MNNRDTERAMVSGHERVHNVQYAPNLARAVVEHAHAARLLIRAGLEVHMSDERLAHLLRVALPYLDAAAREDCQ
jgi:hypothetical protein